ncbi:MGMT family protein [bacterium]|nr:MGMT family protein [candidate division CSSED10-310 bacterium]
MIGRFWAGIPVTFNLDRLAMDACPPFQRRVLLAEFAVPRGSVSTYGRIARHIGSPGSARAVGRALASNPFPILIPCHRTIHEDGKLGGFQGGSAMKRALLEMEGVAMDDREKAVMDKVFY